MEYLNLKGLKDIEAIKREAEKHNVDLIMAEARRVISAYDDKLKRHADAKETVTRLEGEISATRAAIEEQFILYQRADFDDRTEDARAAKSERKALEKARSRAEKALQRAGKAVEDSSYDEYREARDLGYAMSEALRHMPEGNDYHAARVELGQAQNRAKATWEPIQTQRRRDFLQSNPNPAANYRTATGDDGEFVTENIQTGETISKDELGKLRRAHSEREEELKASLR